MVTHLYQNKAGMERIGRLKKHLGDDINRNWDKERESRIVLWIWFELFKLDGGTINGRRIE